jgi:hypothetical protein
MLDGRHPQAIVKLALLAITGGVVLALGALPTVALANWAVEHSGVGFDNLPEELKKPTCMPMTVRR